MSFRPITIAGDGNGARAPFNAIVLAGSFGWAKSQTIELPPRPLALIALRPLITYPIEWLVAAGATTITICANGRSDLLREALGTRYENAELVFKDDQMPRGPAGCVKDAAEAMPSGSIVVVEGATLPYLSLRRLLNAHADSGAALTIAASAGSRNGDLQPAGIYIIEPRALACVPDLGFHDLKESLIPRLYRAGERVLVDRSTRASRRVVNLETYLAANHLMAEQLSGMLSGAHTGAQQVVARTGASVAEGATVLGPVVIGRGARIEPDAMIIGPATIGHDAVVSGGAVVSRSVIGNRSRIGSAAIVHQSIVVDHAEVRANARLYRSVKSHDLSPSGWRRWLMGWRPASSSVGPLGSEDNAVPALTDVVIRRPPRLAGPDPRET